MRNKYICLEQEAVRTTKHLIKVEKSCYNLYQIFLQSKISKIELLKY